METYGPNFANYGGSGDPVIHQYIVIFQLLRKFERSVQGAVDKRKAERISKIVNRARPVVFKS